MPSYKLYYFNVRGRGETARWLFAQAGVDYEDIRLGGEKWLAKKADMPFGQLPTLEVIDDSGKSTMIAQSHAIERYLAREFGFSGKTSLDIALGDSYVDFVTEMMALLPWAEKDPEKKLQQWKEAVDGPIAAKLALLEKFVQPNGVLVGDGCVTYTDMNFAVGSEFLLDARPAALDKTPKLKALKKKVCSEPKIAAWIAKRPVTDI